MTNINKTPLILCNLEGNVRIVHAGLASRVARRPLLPYFFPVAGHMAALALAAEAAIVHIILEVATDACPARLFLAACRLLVAVVTGHFGVPAIQHEAGGPMIEVPGLPGAGVMTNLAPDAEAALVLVVFLVAGITGRRRIVECRGLMTLLALCFGVAPGQRETRLVVVIRGVLPALFIVATFALVA